MQELTRMTLELPTELIQETEKAIAAGIVKNLSEFIALALRQELSNLEQTSKFSSQLGIEPR
jgi:metal-responsive CopG/Arc/MetJ family transcriptional regulator